MYACNHCKKKLKNVPYLCSNNKKYCSYECVPDSTIDEPYSFQYFDLMDGIRDIELEIENIKTLEDRINLEAEIEELSSSYTIEVWGDSEGLFYKHKISLLLEILDELYNKVHNIFMSTKYASMPAVMINWEDLKRIIGEKNASQIFEVFKDELDKFIFDNVYFTWPDYKYKTTDFYYYEDKLKFATMRDAKYAYKLYRENFNDIFKIPFLFLTEIQLEELDSYTYCIDILKLYHCVVCGGWEPWERFSYYDNLKLYKCDEHCGCEDYDHLYQDGF